MTRTSSRTRKSPTMVVVMILVAFKFLLVIRAQQLSADFYSRSCPNAESIVTRSITTLTQQSNVVPPSVLRLFAHDCFVQGCDASVLISSTGSNTAERDATDNKNFPQNPFDAISETKKAVEAACPGVVSCADILAMAARDSVVLNGGPTWTVLKGRRDGLVSQASLVEGHLPGADFDASELTSFFAALGLTTLDMVVLSGGHTMGFSHCNQFSRRLYNFSPTSRTDPSMSSSFVQTLQAQCPPSGGDPGTVQAFDIGTPFVFDNMYYKLLLQGEGLLVSDSTLASSNSTLGFVNQFATSQDAFFQAFTQAMIKMGSVGVKTGTEGEIRRDCTKFNNS